eukprot:TRINITY_DN13227_c0_g1_i2.p1 TRINITY_DN13227_c0_g1~~TRINITY_DN13227_c0_g1_i2.p1  ORF type:complete len:242 (+),score=35.40 TRINITY_DN13227_c0_g1_i2:540-1265(+)
MDNDYHQMEHRLEPLEDPLLLEDNAREEKVEFNEEFINMGFGRKSGKGGDSDAGALEEKPGSFAGFGSMGPAPEGASPQQGGFPDDQGSVVPPMTSLPPLPSSLPQVPSTSPYHRDYIPSTNGSGLPYPPQPGPSPLHLGGNPDLFSLSRQASPAAPLSNPSAGFQNSQDELHYLRMELARRETYLSVKKGEQDMLDAELVTLKTELHMRDQRVSAKRDENMHLQYLLDTAKQGYDVSKLL